MRGEEILFEILEQGTSIVDEAWQATTFDGTQEAVIVRIDMKNRGTECFEYREMEGVPTYSISPPGSLFSEDGADLVLTTISFPSLRGYQIVASNVGRYVHTIAFMKKEEN